MKKITCFLLSLVLIAMALPALAETPGTATNNPNQPQGSGQSPSISVTLDNLSQVTDIVVTGQSPTLSMTLNNLNQITDTNTGKSPTMSMTLNNLNQVTGTSESQVLSPTLSMALYNLNRFSATIEGYGVSLNGLLTIRSTLTKDAQTVFDAIVAYVNSGQAVYGYFGTDVSALVQRGKLSASYSGFDFSKLILSEYVSLNINQEMETDANITSTFGFASEYKDGQTVVAMFGYRDKNGKVIWTALNSMALDGQVVVNIPSQLLRLAGSQAILGVLS